MEGNIYKPRYKIAFLSKNKIWSYKDSRLRRFFNIRGRKLVRRGLFKRYAIVFNNMKWTIARRFIRPYMRRRKGLKRQYRTAFYNKQQLRNFYGKCKEEAFRNFFKAHLAGINRRNDSFYSALERRADMFLFRTRLLPTIYAANQYVRHQGILLNYGLEKSPNALVRPGYLLTVQPEYWSIFAEVLEQRLFYRWHAYGLLKKRVFSRLKKKLRWISRVRKYHVTNEKRVLKKLLLIKRKLVPLKRALFSEYKKRILQWENLYLNKIGNIKKSQALNNTTYTNALINEFNTFREQTLVEGSSMLFNQKRFKTSKRKFKVKATLKTLILKNATRSIKSTNSVKTLQIKSRWRGSEAIFIRKLVNVLTFYKEFFSLFGKLKVMELQYKVFFLNKIAETTRTTSYKKMSEAINDTVENYVKNVQYALDAYSTYLNVYAEGLIKRRIKYRRWKFWNSMDNETGQKEKSVRKTPLFYFIMKKRKKARRRLSVPRLKGVHWYIPSYIHFDFKTMQSIFLYHPLAQEIHYSFKASLPKLFSFYRSR